MATTKKKVIKKPKAAAKPRKPKPIVVVLHRLRGKGPYVKYTVIVNEIPLEGLAIKSFRGGVEQWECRYKKERISYYNPQWLIEKNGRKLVLPEDHPSMRKALLRRLISA